MANEATVFSLTSAEQLTGTANQAGGNDVDVATANASAVPASIDIGLYYLKTAYESGDGRSKLLRHLDKIRDRISRAPIWPPV